MIKISLLFLEKPDTGMQFHFIFRLTSLSILILFQYIVCFRVKSFRVVILFMSNSGILIRFSLKFFHFFSGFPPSTPQDVFSQY